MSKEREILENALELDSGLAVILLNHNSNMKMIKKDMTTALDLLDGVADGNKEQKDMLRKKILDNYNGLMRDNLDLIEKITKELKKE